jgi:hypothetical protein
MRTPQAKTSPWATQRRERLSQELSESFTGIDGTRIVNALQDGFQRDFDEWFYQRLFPYFRRLPLEEWSEAASGDAELACSHAAALFFAFRSGTLAARRKFIPETRVQWFVAWQLRLFAGQSIHDSNSLAARLLPAASGAMHARQAFIESLGNCLPRIRALGFVTSLYAETFDLRIEATTCRAFGADRDAHTLYSSAVAREEALGSGIRQHWSGGGSVYVLENDEGVLVKQSRDYGRVFHVWTKPEYADEMNERVCQGTHRVSRMNFRELEGQLRRMQASGIGYLVIDHRVDGELQFMPIGKMLERIRGRIQEVESSELGKLLAQGFRED